MVTTKTLADGALELKLPRRREVDVDVDVVGGMLGQVVVGDCGGQGVWLVLQLPIALGQRGGLWKAGCRDTFVGVNCHH